jgi:hypothetical protein
LSIHAAAHVAAHASLKPLQLTASLSKNGPSADVLSALGLCQTSQGNLQARQKLPATVFHTLEGWLVALPCIDRTKLHRWAVVLCCWWVPFTSAFCLHSA